MLYYKKTNYSAWNIDSSLFTKADSNIEKLRFFAQYAILAPSGHNSQPWELCFNDDKLTIRINESRHLSIDGSGLLSVEPWISIGTFIESLSLAALGYGYLLNISLLPNNYDVAHINIEGHRPCRTSILEAITTRVSNRNPFATTPVDAKILKTLVSSNVEEIRTTIVTQKNDIKFVAEQTGVAIQSIMSNPNYREELSKWVRTNQTRKYDGMPGFTHGFNNAQSLISKAAVKHIPNHGPQADKSSSLINTSGALIIVECLSDSHESFINSGRMYSHICTVANEEGFATSALGAAVLDPKTRKLVSERFDIKNRPVYILRIGKATLPASHSPRWPLSKIIAD